MTSSPEQKAAFIHELYELGHQMRVLGSFVDVTNYVFEGQNMAAKARRAAGQVAGEELVGHIVSNQFYRFQPRRPDGQPAYQRYNVNDRSYHEKDFRGVFKRLVNIEVPILNGAARRICLQLSPLSKQDDRQWLEHFRELGREEQARHPFGRPELAGQSAFVPVEALEEGKLYFPETPSEAVTVIRRSIARTNY